MAYGHGWGKLSGYAEMSEKFPDPIGLGSQVSLTLAVFAEFFCSILVMAGFLTRLACVPLISTMAVAGFIFHSDDPFAKKEMAFLYLAAWVVILLLGPGKISVDGVIGKMKRV